MGFRVQLIAVTQKEPVEILSSFGVSATGRREEIAESPVVGARLPSGAFLLYINDPDRIAPNERIFSLLSEDASLIACYANETVMQSYACGWSNGVELWSVFRDAQQDIAHLEVTGSPPQELQQIRNRLFEQQAVDDGADFIFDIPIELFVALGGIRYDQDIPGADPEPWEILE